MDDKRTTLSDRTQVYPEHRNIIPEGPRKGQHDPDDVRVIALIRNALAAQGRG